MKKINKKDEIGKKEIEEYKKFIKETLHMESKTQEFKSKIFFDGKQYNTRIPVKLAKILNINPKKHYIRFVLTTPSTIKEKPKVEINLGEENAS